MEPPDGEITAAFNAAETPPPPPPRKRGSAIPDAVQRTSISSSAGSENASPTRIRPDVELPSPIAPPRMSVAWSGGQVSPVERASTPVSRTGSPPAFATSGPGSETGQSSPKSANGSDLPGQGNSPRTSSPRTDSPPTALIQEKLASLRMRMGVKSVASVPPPIVPDIAEGIGNGPPTASSSQSSSLGRGKASTPEPVGLPATTSVSLTHDTESDSDDDALSFDESSEQSSILDQTYINDMSTLPSAAGDPSLPGAPHPALATIAENEGSRTEVHSATGLHHRPSPAITVNTDVVPVAEQESANRSSQPSELSAPLTETPSAGPSDLRPPEITTTPAENLVQPSVAAWQHILKNAPDLVGLVPRLAVDPLTSPYPIFTYIPHFLDSLSGSLPVDAWDVLESIDEEMAVGGKEVGDPVAKLRESRNKRDHVMKEIYETEVSYLSKLQIMDRVFRTQMRRLLGDAGEPSVRRIFGGLDELLAIHTDFKGRLRQLCTTWTDESGVGELFREFKPKLTQGYAIFIDNFQNCRDEMTNLDRTNSEYRQFMADCLTSPETGKTNLAEYMLYPVQRTARYALLLREMVKNTPQTHPDYQSVKDAQKEMEEWTNRVNELKRLEEERTAMFQAYSQTENCPANLINFNRRLVFQCDATDAKTSKPWRLFLFSDLIMVAKPIQKGGMWFFPSTPAVEGDKLYKYVRWLDFRDITVADDTLTKNNRTQVRIFLKFSRSANTVTTFAGTDDRPASANETITFSFGSDDERDRFLAALQSEIKRGKKT